MPKRKSKNSTTLIEVVRDQQKVIAILRKYAVTLETELKLHDIATQKSNDEQIKLINARLRSKLIKHEKGEMVMPKIPERTADEIVADINVRSELAMVQYFNHNRPDHLL